MDATRVFLEIRFMLPSARRAFCACRPGPGTGGCPVCRRERGAVPDVNPAAVEFACTLAAGLACTLAENPLFERQKVLPAIPAHYRLSPLSLQVAADGHMDIRFHRREKRIRITGIRIEEYAGCPVPGPDQTLSEDYSYAGCPCIRLRSAPGFETGDETEIFIDELLRRIRYTGIFSGGRAHFSYPHQSARCNAYVAAAGSGCFVKIRNLGSFDSVKLAVDQEIRRQEDLLSAGRQVRPESYIWDARKNAAVFYREHPGGFTETVPVLPSPEAGHFRCPPALLAALRATVFEHPSERRDRFIRDYGLSWQMADFLCADRQTADFFDQLTALDSGDPPVAARWIATLVMPALRKRNLDIGHSALSPRRLAAVLALRRAREISAKNVQQLLDAVLDTDGDPAQLVDEHGWRLLCDPRRLSAAVRQAVAENPGAAEQLKNGGLHALEFLTGKAAQAAGAPVDPELVRRYLQEELSLCVTCVLLTGGSSGPDGEKLEKAGKDSGPADGCPGTVKRVLLRRIPCGEMQPSGWAVLIAAVAEEIQAGNAGGIVILHGPDTLAFTAPLLYWLFAGAPVPVVLLAEDAPPGGADERNLRMALRLAQERKTGVYVVAGGRILSPLNLKLLRAPVSGFTNWNMEKPVFTGSGLLLEETGGTDAYVLGRVLSDAADRMHLCRIFPGLRADRLLALIDAGVTDFFLEIYGRGSGSMRDSRYSLKPLLLKGRQKGCRFYCTSQQECEVTLSGSPGARGLWRAGLVPMGGLTTETAIALYFAASLVCDTPGELLQTMETAAACW